MTENTKQPEALRLADCLDRDNAMNWPDYDNTENAAAELRRLHALNEDLVEALRGMLEAYDDGVTDWEKPYQQAARAAIAKTGATS